MNWRTRGSNDEFKILNGELAHLGNFTSTLGVLSKIFNTHHLAFNIRNRLPLVQIEQKRHGLELKEAFNQLNIRQFPTCIQSSTFYTPQTQRA